MPCQIGITTDPERRRRQWTRERPTLRNWEILGAYATKTLAQNAENQLAQQYGCNHGEGGDGPEQGPWYSYRFDY